METELRYINLHVVPIGAFVVDKNLLFTTYRLLSHSNVAHKCNKLIFEILVGGFKIFVFYNTLKMRILSH